MTVVGKVPNTTTVREILWDGATIDIDHADARAGLAQVADAVSRWTPSQGELQIRQGSAAPGLASPFRAAVRGDG